MQRSRKRKLRRQQMAVASAPLAVSVLMVSPVYAQQTTAGLEEIVVTATKRTESMQEVPISIQAFGTEKLEQLNVARFDDYVKMLPSVSVQSGGSGFGTVYFRGVAAGGDGNHSGSMPSTGIYLDEQPITTIQGALDVHIYDIERVEALAGPQGTLFGASAQAGVIRIITNKPDPSKFSAGYGLQGSTISGGDQGYVAEGFVNLPLHSNAAVRLVGWAKKDPGWIDNVPAETTYPVSGITVDNSRTVEKNYNDIETVGGRAALRFILNDNWTITPQLMAQNADFGGVNYMDQQFGKNKVGHYAPEKGSDSWYQGSLTVEGKVGNWDMTYAGAYLERETDVDGDYQDYSYFYDKFYESGNSLYDNNYNLVDPSQFTRGRDGYQKFSQELRFTSPKENRLRFVGGLFFQRQYHDIQQRYMIAGDIADWISVTGWDNTIWLTKEDRVDRDKAVFGELSYDITDKLTGTIGGRYFEARNSLEGFFGYALGYSSKTGEDACNGVIGDPYAQDEADRPYWPKFRNAPCKNFSKQTDEKDAIYKGNLTYKFDADRMAYITYSEGYRPGGVNRRGTLPPYQSDKLENYEFGWKTSWLDNRLRINGALFLEKWNDFQFSIIGANGLTEIRNANQAEIKGLEADFEFAVTDAFRLSGGFALLDPKLTANYCGFVNPETGRPETRNPCPKPLSDGSTVLVPPEAKKGTELPVTPKFKANLTGRYEFDMGDWNSHVQATVLYSDKARLDLLDQDFRGLASPNYNLWLQYPDDYDANPAQFHGTGYSDSYTLLDMSFGIGRDNYAIELFINNVFDDSAVTQRSTNVLRYGIGGERLYETTVLPRTIALKFSQKF